MPESQTKFRFWWFFFSLKGRVTRVPFAAFMLGSKVLLESTAFLVAKSISPDRIGLWSGLSTALGLIGLLLLWPQFALLTKRLHDVALPFWLGLLFFVPKQMQFAYFFWRAQMLTDPLSTHSYYVGPSMLIPAINIAVLIGLVTLAFLPGTKGTNRYGPHPHRPDQSASKVF